MIASSIETPLSRSGVPALLVDGVQYHSAYDPIRESARFFNDLKLEQADVICLFGWGLGYGADALVQRAKSSARILVLEANDEFLSLSKTRIPTHSVWCDPRFQFISGPALCQYFSHHPPIWCQETDKVLWVEWPPALTLYGSVLQELKDAFRVCLRDRAANLLTHFQNGRLYFSNVVRNLDYLGDADAGRLFGKFQGVPLVIVSAGPSLDRNVRALAAASEQCLILAVDTALRPLLEAGVGPHAVITADPTEFNSRHVAGVLPEDTFLIAEQGVDTAAMKAARQRFIFGLGLFPDPLFRKFGLQRTALDVWGSVATAALDLACRSGANPVIFAGQDFAYSWRREYARYTIFDQLINTGEKEPVISARDIWNVEIPTSENLVAYRDFFVRRMKAAPHTRFINATEGGILTEGAEILSLRDALQQSCKQTMDVRAKLKACHHNEAVPVAAMDHLKKVLLGEITGCTCRDGFLELAAKEALLRGNGEELNNALRWGLETLSRSL